MKEVNNIPGIQNIQQIEGASKKEKELKRELITYILAHTLHETVTKHLEATTSTVTPPSHPKAAVTETPKASLGAAPKPSLGSSLPLPPIPGGASSDAPDPSVPSTNDEIRHKLDVLLEDLAGDPSNPATLQKFLTYLTNLDHAGKIGVVQDLLDAAKVTGDGSQPGLLGPAAQEMIIIEFFNKGKAAAEKLLAQMKSYLESLPKSKYIDSLLHGLNTFDLNKFADEHKNGNWNLYGYDYNWNNQDDQDTILRYLFNIGSNATPPNSYFGPDGLDIKEFSRKYRLEQIDSMIAMAHGDPNKLMIMVCLFFGKDADDRIQRQETGLANTTNRLSDMTNNYMTPLVDKLNTIGPNMTDQDAADIANLYINANIRTNAEGQFSNLAPAWNKNTVTPINNLMVLDTRGGVGMVGMGSLIEAWKNQDTQPPVTTADLKKAFQSLVPTPPSGESPSPSTSPGYQTLLTAFQSGSSLFTGASKQITTQLAALSNVENAINKFLHAIADTTGGGIAAMLTKFVGNQISR